MIKRIWDNKYFSIMMFILAMAMLVSFASCAPAGSETLSDGTTVTGNGVVLVWVDNTRGNVCYIHGDSIFCMEDR